MNVAMECSSKHPPPDVDHAADFHPGSSIRGILRDCRVSATAGASTNWTRPSHLAIKYPIRKGFNARAVDEELSKIGRPVDLVRLFRRLDKASGVVDDSLALDLPQRVVRIQLAVAATRLRRKPRRSAFGSQ